jgi:hypothetical protein
MLSGALAFGAESKHPAFSGQKTKRRVPRLRVATRPKNGRVNSVRDASLGMTLSAITPRSYFFGGQIPSSLRTAIISPMW